MTRRISISINIADLLSLKKKVLKGLFANKEGGFLSAKEARAFLQSELDSGKKILPCNNQCGNPCANADKGCKGFDYQEKGCAGYEINQVTNGK